MSRINGDRSRFDRMRKARMHARTIIRNLRKELATAKKTTEPKRESANT